MSSNKSEYKLVLEPGWGSRDYWRDLWQYSELLMHLAWRDIAVRYKQTVIGIAWAVIRPVLMTVILVVIFGKIAQLSSGGIPYVLLVLSGMMTWQLFATGMTTASNSLVTNANLVSKIYFPRLVVPLSTVGVSLVDFLITLPILVVVMIWYGYAPTWRIVFLPLFVLLTMLASLSIGILLCAVNVGYRDFRYVLPFVVQFGLYVTPVGFGLDAVRERSPNLAYLMSLNPLTGVIEGFRWSLLGRGEGLTPFSLAVSLGVIFVMLFLGIRYFRRTERTFADVI